MCHPHIKSCEFREVAHWLEKFAICCNRPHNFKCFGRVAYSATFLPFPVLEDSRQHSVKKCLSPRPSCQESWWGLLGQKGHSFPPEAVAWAPKLLVLSLQYTPHLPSCLPHSLCLIHLLNPFFCKSIFQCTQHHMVTLLRSHIESDIIAFDMRLGWSADSGLKRENDGVCVENLFVIGREA